MSLAVSTASLIQNAIQPRPNSYIPYKTRTTFEERSLESLRIRERFPGRVPIIVERSGKSLDIPLIDKNKFLAPGDLNVSQFLHVVRRRMQLPGEVALFLFVANTLPTTGTLLRELYANYAEHDGFLYMAYSGENTFG